MKRLAILSSILMLALCASLASAQPARPSVEFSNQLLNEVVRMSDAGMGSDTIIAYVRARQSRLEPVTAEDLIALRRARVSEPVVQFLAGLTPSQTETRSVEVVATPAEGEGGGDGETVAVDGQPRSYGGWGWGWGWGWPYWGWGWGYPYYGTGFVVHGGHGHGGHWGGGGHGGHGGGGHGGGHGGGGHR